MTPAVLFEVTPLPGRAQRYFDSAAALRPMLDGIDGFASVERFESISRPGTCLLLSWWRDDGMHDRTQAPPDAPAAWL